MQIATVTGAVFLAGVALIWYGLSQIHQPTAFVVVGAMLVVLSVGATAMRARRRE